MCRRISAVLLRLRAIHLKQRTILKPHRSKFSTPDAACVEPDEIWAQRQSQCRPMAKDASHVSGLASRHIEPRQVALRRSAGTLLDLEIDAAVRPAKSHSRQGIDDATQTIITFQIIRPYCRFVAIHMAQEVDPIRAAQFGFYFMRQ